MCLDCYDMQVYGKGWLGGPWIGWRLAGRDLVTPERQRVPVEALKGLMVRWELDCWRMRRAVDRQRYSGSAGAIEGIAGVIELGPRRTHQAHDRIAQQKRSP